MTDPFRVPVATRGYEVDSNGHVAGTVLLQYGMHARCECLRAAGVDQHQLLQRGLGPVSLEDSIRYHHELRAGEEVESLARSTGDRARPSACSNSCTAPMAP